MVLSDVDIRRHMLERKIKIEPFSEEQLGAASVDLTLSGKFWRFKKQYVGKKLDLLKIDFREATEPIVSESVELAPGEMCLGLTEEKITLSGDVIGHLEGRSRYARMGLAVHVTSALVQPGSDNHQVLEIVNMSQSRLVIHKGMRVSQVVFERMDSPTTKPYSKFGKIAVKQ